MLYFSIGYMTGFLIVSEKKFVLVHLQHHGEIRFTMVVFSDGVEDMTAATVPDIMKSIGFLISV